MERYNERPPGPMAALPRTYVTKRAIYRSMFQQNFTRKSIIDGDVSETGCFVFIIPTNLSDYFDACVT